MGGYDYMGPAGLRKVKAWVKSLVPTKLSQLSNDPGYVTDAGVIGVKGGSEAGYRTGRVNITKADIGLGNVEDKSSATIRGELTKANVTSALGYEPPRQDTAYRTVGDLPAS